MEGGDRDRSPRDRRGENGEMKINCRLRDCRTTSTNISCTGSTKCIHDCYCRSQGGQYIYIYVYLFRFEAKPFQKANN